MIWRLLLSSFIVLAVVSSSARPNNNAFLPGDAFFHARVTNDEIEHAMKDKGLLLSYVRIQEPALCGFAGYTRLRIADPDGQLIRRLATVYAIIRRYQPAVYRKEADDAALPSDAGRDLEERGSVGLREVNGVSVLVYNPDFDITKSHLCLEYNERWMNDIVSFGYDARGVRLGPMVDSKDAFEESWRNSPRVDPLHVSLPEAEIKQGQWVVEPMVAEDDVALVVLPSYNYHEYFAVKKSAVIYYVTTKAIVEYEARQRKWVVSGEIEVE